VTNFDETAHPRQDGGQFAAKIHAEAGDVTLDEHEDQPLAELVATRDQLFDRFEANGGRGVDEAEEIDALDRQIEGLREHAASGSIDDLKAQRAEALASADLLEFGPGEAAKLWGLDDRIASLETSPLSSAPDPDAARSERLRNDRLARNESIATSFRASGSDVRKVVTVPYGYCAFTTDRTDAFSAAQIMLDNFAGDPESGCPTITIEQTSAALSRQQRADSWSSQLAGNDPRPDGEAWETTMTAKHRDTSALDDPQRAARHEALTAATGVAEGAKSQGWVEKVEVTIERPDPDSFWMLVKIDGRADDQPRKWTAQR